MNLTPGIDIARNVDDRFIEVIGARTGLGGRCRGTSHGPTAIRAAGLVRRVGSVRDLGDVVARDAVRAVGRDPGAALVQEVERYSLELRDTVEAVLRRGGFPLILGGDHSLGAATQAAIGRACRVGSRVDTSARHGAPGLLWIDAHTDANTMETTPSGNLHGMMLAAIHGLDVPAFRSVVKGGLRDPARTVYVGARDIDEEERAIVAQLGCRVMTPDEIRDLGPTRAMDEAMRIAGGDDGRFSASFDLDSLDPSIAPGVDCHVPGGFLWDEARAMLERVGRAPGLVAVEVVEVNPTADHDGRTARLAVEACALLCGR
jgi:arginase